SLTEYQRKRDFRRTPEPKGRQPKKEETRRYVVHRHHATRLHWDVRLEMRGILASWAVPNGPPLEAGKKRLAVHTEDHPIEYLTFHGVIPDGYGAGSMTIWDTGTYVLLEEKDDELKLRFNGKRLKGEWVLVKTRQNEGRDWLMIKHGTPPKNDPLLGKIAPMLAAAADEPFDSPEFTYEAKWDGVRTIAFVDGGEVRLQTRNLLDCTRQYPEGTQEQGLEGIIAKRLDSTYQPGARSPAWVKVKAFRTMDCVVGGWTAGQGGRASTLGALLLGVYRDGKLEPVGHVGTGFDERTLRDLLATLEKHESPTSPFATMPRVNQPARWCMPELVCEVEYVEITRDGTLRHPTYRGLRPDVDPRESTGEERRESAKRAQEAAKKAAVSLPVAGNGEGPAR